MNARANVRTRLARLEEQMKPRVSSALIAGASAKCQERFTRYINDPAVPESAKAEKILFIIGMMAKTRSEETMFALLSRLPSVTDPAAALVEGRAVYQRLNERMKV